VSLIIVFLSEAVFLVRAVGGNTKVTVDSRFRGWRLPVFSMLTQSSFWNALRILGILLFGRLGDRQRMVNPFLAAEIQKFVPNFIEQLMDLDVVAQQMITARSARPGAKFSLEGIQTPKSLAYTLPQLVWLLNLLDRWGIRSTRLLAMLPELLVVVNAFVLMEKINYQISPTAYLRREIEVVQMGLDHGLVRDLNLQDLNREQPSVFRSLLAGLEAHPSDARLGILLTYLFRLMNRHQDAAGKEYRASVLRLVSLMDPANQLTVELRGNGVEPTLISLPAVIFREPRLLDYVLTIMENAPEGFVLYNRDGRQIEHPVNEMRFGGAA
jgi:hypothetical protein